VVVLPSVKIEGTMRVFALRPPPGCPARLPARGPSGRLGGVGSGVLLGGVKLGTVEDAEAETDDDLPMYFVKETPGPGMLTDT
jgi:hypothetical protein